MACLPAGSRTVFMERVWISPAVHLPIGTLVITVVTMIRSRGDDVNNLLTPRAFIIMCVCACVRERSCLRPSIFERARRLSRVQILTLYVGLKVYFVVVFLLCN